VELALNLGWFVISIAAFVFFVRRFRATDETQRLVTACIALACVVCLLFPVVSMTDDLNSSPAMPEATKFKRLFSSSQVVIHEFSFVACPQELTWAVLALAFDQEQAPAQQELLSFDLHMRPPPALQSLLT
jgi:hypothetical protein